METVKKADRYKKLSENAFFYVEANTSVHSALIQDGDAFKVYGYAEIKSEEQARNLSSKPAIAREFEKMIRGLPSPPRAIQTWF
jgi:endonuclease YncB( thermonuclease family)